jgi:NAD(P)-dependent dehydrogenase (short-subunit alcohol dehydrogenase family)
MKALTGKVALITGGNRGIGYAASKADLNAVMKIAAIELALRNIR